MALFDLLHRFRHLGAPPGRPARPVGVPASEGEAIKQELAPLFATLDSISDEYDGVVADAERHAADLRERTAAQAASIVAAAHASAPAIRSQAAAEYQQSMREQAEQVRKDAEREVSRIEAQAQDELPGVVEEIVHCMLRGSS